MIEPDILKWMMELPDDQLLGVLYSAGRIPPYEKEYWRELLPHLRKRAVPEAPHTIAALRDCLKLIARHSWTSRDHPIIERAKAALRDGAPAVAPEDRQLTLAGELLLLEGIASNLLPSQRAKLKDAAEVLRLKYPDLKSVVGPRDEQKPQDERS